VSVAPHGHGAPASERDLRLDKWLWAARLYKTRALAAEDVLRGRVLINDLPAKPARALRPGDRLLLRSGATPRELIVRSLSRLRGPAAQAQALYEETAASREARERAVLRRREAADPAEAIEQGRPTKRERRRLASWQRWSASVDGLADDAPE
jgi:ribosome-associated heat shock protein Hsp15